MEVSVLFFCCIMYSVGRYTKQRSGLTRKLYISIVLADRYCAVGWPLLVIRACLVGLVRNGSSLPDLPLNPSDERAGPLVAT